MGKKYFTAAQLASELRLSPTQVDLQQLAPDLGCYRMCSKVTYLDSRLAAAQARQIWDQSTMVERFAEKKVERARYAFREVETGYCAWLGRLEKKPWEHWARQESRAELLKNRAMNETLRAALDMNGYRKCFKLGFNLLGDDDLLWKLHYHRSQSKYVPPHVRAESQRWVHDHPQESLSR